MGICRDVDFKPAERAKYPEDLQSRFGKNRFLRLETSQYLDYRGAGLLFIAVDKDVLSELGIDLEADEDKGTARVFEDLRLERSSHRTTPFFQGEWA